jgi:hypothetical protein
MGEWLSCPGDCRRSRFGYFQAGKVQQNLPFTLLQLQQPGPRHFPISLWRHGVARLSQQDFDSCDGLLRFFQLLIVRNHSSISRMPRVLPFRVVCKQSRTLSNITFRWLAIGIGAKQHDFPWSEPSCNCLAERAYLRALYDNEMVNEKAPARKQSMVGGDLPTDSLSQEAPVRSFSHFSIVNFDDRKF